MQQDPLTLDNSRKTQLDSNIKKMLEGGASNDDVMSYASDFKNKFGVKKKDDFQVDSQIGSEPLPIGSKPFQAQVDTKIPSVLTEQGKVGYEQEIAKPRPKEKPILDFSAIKNSPKPRDAYYQDPTIAAREEKARLKQLQKNYEAGKLDRNTFTQDLNLVAASGIDMLGRMASTIPSGILDNAIQAFGNQPGGLVSMGIDAEVLGKIAEKKLGLPEEYNPLSPNNALAETFRKKAELNQSLSRKGYSGGITDALKLGEYKDAAKLLAFGFTESLPILLGLAATRGSGMSSTGSLISTGLGTQATTYQDLKTENPEIAKNILFLNATLTGIGEAGSEVTGTNLLYNQARKLFVKGQKEQAKEIVTKGIKEYLDYAFQKSFVGSAVLGDMSGEVANQIWKNATDKWSGVRPDVDYLDGVGDAALISAFTTSTIAAGAKSLAAIVNPKTKDKIDDTSLKISNLQKEADNPDMPDAARTVIVNEIGNLTESINEDLKKDNVQYNDLDDDQKTTVDNLSDKRDEIKSALNNAAVSDETKQVLQKQLNDIDLQIESILSTKPTPEIKLAKPTFDTKEQLVEEIRAAEKEFNETGDSAEYQLKINDLNTRLENLVPELEEEQSATDLFKIDGQDKFYHASPKKREGRLREGTAPQFGKGVYFSTNKDLVIDEFGNEVTEVQIKAKKPLFTNSKEEVEVKNLAAKKWNEENLTYDSENEMYVDKDGNEVTLVDAGDLGERLPISYYSSAAKELGYDVIVDKDSSSYDNEIVVIDESIITYPEETPKPQEDAVQVEAAGQVPVLTEAPVGEEVEQGKPQPEAKVVAEEGKEEVGGVVEPIGEIVKPKSIRLNSSEEGLVKMEGLKAKDVYPTRQFFKNKSINVGLPDVGSPQFDPFISENKDNTKEEIVDLSEITPTQELVDKSGIGGKLTIGNPKLVRFNDGLFVLDGHHRISTEAVGGNTKIKADVTTIDMTSDEWGQKKIDKFLNEQQVEQLRAEEQAELKAAIPNADQYLTDGKVDRAKITDAKDLKKFDEIYDKYDKLITPLLTKQEAPKTVELPKLNESNIENAVELLDDIRDNKRKSERASSKRKATIEQKIIEAENELNKIPDEAKIVKAINDNFDKIKKDLKEQGLLNVKC